jgi:hypothetical protein
LRLDFGPESELLETGHGDLLVGHVHVSTRLLEAFSVPISRGGRGEGTGDAVTLSPLATPPGPRGYSPLGIGEFPV